MAQKRGFHFSLARHYDKALAVLALVLLLLSLFVLARSGAENRRRDREYRRGVERLTPAHPQSTPIDTQVYDKAIRNLRRPQPLDVSTNGYGFFLPELRVWCVDCHYAIPFAAEVCPFCETKQPPPASVPMKDKEGKGIPDKWRETYFRHDFASGDDKSRAEDDADGDGFTNQEEFLAGTDPRDPQSHPDLAGKLRFKEFRPKPYPFVFMSATKMPDNTYRIAVNMKSENRTRMVKLGEPIGNTGLVYSNYVRRIEHQKNASVGIVDVDVSEIHLCRPSDNRTFILPINNPRSLMEQELVFDLETAGTRAEYRVATGGVLDLKGQKYRVNVFDDKASSVVLENILTGKKFTVSR